jgi:hypothetical protein
MPPALWSGRLQPAPDSKTSKKAAVLSGAARKTPTTLLRKFASEGSAQAANRYVIVGDLPGQRRDDLKRLWKLVFEYADWLAYAFMTYVTPSRGDRRWSEPGLPIIGKLLGHTKAQTTARYDISMLNQCDMQLT